MSEPIKLALTAEEWAHPEHRVEREGFWIYEPPILTCPVVGSERHGVSIGEVRHALAALALYAQPFGFTREDVRLLRVAAEAYDQDPFYFRDLEPVSADLPDESPVPGMYRALAARIEALLPPE